MGLFGNLFKKQACICCGKECGALGRTKLRDGDYVCSDCVRNCSQYVRISEFTKEQLDGHMAYMEHQERMYQTFCANGKRVMYPSNVTITNQAIVFYDEIGMFEIIDRKNGQFKNHHELFRYDQVAGYEAYVKYGTPKDGQSEKPFEEYGVIIRLLSDREAGAVTSDSVLKGRRTHPYVKQPITLCFSTKEEDYKKFDDSRGVIQHFDAVFGVNDDMTGLFSFKGSKNEQRKMQANVDMAKMFASTIKAVKAGEDSEEMKAAEAQFNQTRDSVEAYQTGGLSAYSRAADEAESRCLR